MADPRIRSGGRHFADERHLPCAAYAERIAMPTMGRMLLAMKGEQHRINRALVSRAFLPHAIERRVGDLLAPVANQVIDDFGARRELDLVADFTHRFPFNVISRMLGIPVSDETQVMKWVFLLLRFPWEPDRKFDDVLPAIDYREPKRTGARCRGRFSVSIGRGPRLEMSIGALRVRFRP
jgi:cytochrome P450